MRKFFSALAVGAVTATILVGTAPVANARPSGDSAAASAEKFTPPAFCKPLRKADKVAQQDAWAPDADREKVVRKYVKHIRTARKSSPENMAKWLGAYARVTEAELPGKPVPSEEVMRFVSAQRPMYANVIIEMCGFDLFR